MLAQFTLSDGRKLDYQVLGKTDATPLLWYGGTPSARLVPPGIAPACEKHGLSVVAFSRPGYGSSTRQRGRSVLDTLSDAKELLKHLGHSRFYAGGWSGGGPYALASAAKLEGCIAAVAVAGTAPYEAEGLDWLAGQGQDNVDEFKAALGGEESLQAFLKPAREGMVEADAEGIVSAVASLIPDVDKKAILEDNEIGTFTEGTFREGLKESADGWADDDLAFLKPWGFDVKDIRVPVFLYQGSLDAFVPFAHGKWLAAHIPPQYLNARLYDGEGHFSIFLGRGGTMVDELVGVAQK